MAVGPGPLLTAAKPVAVAGLVEGAAGAAHRGQEDARRASAATARAGDPELGSRAKRSRGTSSFNSKRPAPALTERKRAAERWVGARTAAWEGAHRWVHKQEMGEPATRGGLGNGGRSWVLQEQGGEGPSAVQGRQGRIQEQQRDELDPKG